MRSSRKSSGNVLFMLLIAVALIAALTYAITRSQGGNNNLTVERANIFASQLASFGIDLKRAVDNMTRAGISESAISFASSALTGYGTPDTTPKNEVFNIAGGGVSMVAPGNTINDGSQWEFSGFTAAPGVGDDATADLMVVFPNVTQALCKAYNKKVGYNDTDAIPTDSGVCLYDTSKRYNGTFASGGMVNSMDAGTFKTTPAPAACVACGSAYHAYYVLISR